MSLNFGFRVSTAVVVGVSMIALTACNQAPTVSTELVANPASCLELLNRKQPDTAVDNKTKCDNDYKAALAEHRVNAPSFKTREDCKAEFPELACETTAPTHNAGGGFFAPMMAGYLLGSMMNRNGAVTNNPPQAAYKNSSGYMNTGGKVLSSGLGAVTARGDSDMFKKSPDRTTTVSRGGFSSKSASTRTAPARQTSSSRVR
jgi:uncharacterized protein YgiB involved in biofilm formation